MLKKLLLFPFALMLILCLPIYAGAEGVHNDQAPQISESEIIKVYKASATGLSEISVEEYNEILAQGQALEAAKEGLIPSIPLFITDSSFDDASVIAPRDAYQTTIYSYQQNGYVSYVTRSGLTRRISQPVYNSASANSLLNISYSVSQGYIANTSFGVTAKQTAVSTGITGGSSWSNTYGGSNTTTASVNPYNYAWMEYTPIMNNSFGVITEKTYANVQGSSVLVGTTSYDVDIYMARLLSGSLPDGVYAIKQSASNPG
ncbi:hypothetical protein MHI27_22625 [Paenibacillus sp. FSL H8-0261]|uniref:hypothetical protein n=1 Tax=unclassified Paenibacillus TaxID=185978 RepID=UPI0004F5E8BE|nr:hypothetical protein [Paenibacillus sp. FSL H7-0737]AIQ25347.1 hypothetical protein H70737_22270 [Paenibacillus sp. FSL H7-0737]